MDSREIQQFIGETEAQIAFMEGEVKRRGNK